MTSRGMGLVVAASLMAAMGGVTVAACTGDDPPRFQEPQPDSSVTPVPTNTSSSGASGAANGAECATDGQCSSSHCVDKVCCESSCSGTCERCNDPSALGKCSPIAKDTDPESECPAMLPEVDAGVDLDSGDPDATVVPSVLLPDGGVPSVDHSACAGKCDGNRKCGYPTSDTTCGAKFCTASTTQGAARCDGTGRCSYGAEECTAGACADGGAGCATSCTNSDACLPGFYCDGASCKATVGLGVTCTGASQCTSGACASGVCCETACEGGTCTAAGKCIYTCKECDAGPCALYFEDKDKDGYGAKDATIGNGRAKLACADTTPSGFAANNTDCYDGPAPPAVMDPDAKNVHPNADYQTKGFKIGADPTVFYDWDCNGVVTKELPDTYGKSCYTCAQTAKGCQGTTVTTRCVGDVQFSHSCLKSSIGKDECVENPKALGSFGTTTPCGTTGPFYVCGECTRGVIVGASDDAKTQRCR